ncbi:MAG: hypothetical protein AB7Y46_01190 [Armatimonadota bacterium]
MDELERPHERWIWTELIGFDNGRVDLGVGEYLEAAGFVPTGISLLLTSPDFVLSHQGPAGEFTLPPDVCSRDGHEFNPHRQRQAWTNRQLHGLIGELHERGIAVFLSVFTRFYGNRFHHEWLSDHPEACKVFRRHGWAASLNPLARLRDGSYFEDYFIGRLVEVMRYYGFDGWHGADGWGPHNGPIYEVDLSDDTIAQFAQCMAPDLPAEVIEPCGHDIGRLEVRAQWLWRHARHEWIQFHAERWERFWRKALEALHAAGKRAFINSAWGRAPWEALYRYGVDYRRIVAAGVDGIVVETVAAGLSMDPRPYAADPTRHADFLSMLMLMRAALPEARLIFLHNTHDTVEEWDAIRHCPTLLEKEIYSLANVFHTERGGALRPCADGFLVCLGDGLDQWHWRWLRERWRLAYCGDPARALGAALVWSDALLDAQVADFTATRGWTVHRLAFHLITAGAPVQTTVDIGDLEGLGGALLVLRHDLLPPEELAAVLGYQGGPIVLVGRKLEGLPRADPRFDDIAGRGSLSCLVYGAQAEAPAIEAWEVPVLSEDLRGIEEPAGYWEHFTFAPVSPGFLAAVAQVIAAVSGAPRVVEQADVVTLMATEEASGRLRVALKSSSPFYARPAVDVGRPIAEVQILSEYPSLVVQPEGSTFRVRVPPKGVTVVSVTLADGPG